MKLAFLGTPDFSVPVLAALLEAGHDVVCVYSQPPRPAGRGHKERPSPVHALADQRGIPVRTPKSLKSAEEQAAFAALDLDVAVVAAYGLILPVPVLTAPRLGCLNVHASILPRWRGAAPIQRVIEAGDLETGVTIMQMDQGLDTGAMLSVERTPITPETTGQSLHDALSAIGARQIVAALDELEQGRLTATPQPADGVTYAKKLDKDEGRLDWTRPAEDLARMIRAFDPWPGSWCLLPDGERLKVLAARAVEGSGPPGTLLAAPLVVACGQGALALTRVQRPGRAPMTADEMTRGHAITLKSVFN